MHLIFCRANLFADSRLTIVADFSFADEGVVHILYCIYTL